MTLVVCPTPIGNLEDVTLRVLSVLRGADVVACEDTRHTAKLLSHHGVRASSLVSLHEHNESARAASLVERLVGGEVVAERALPPARDVVRIELAVLGPEAGLIGAAVVGFEALDAATV